MLANAGLAIECAPARIDESAVKASMVQEGHSARNICDALAELKAQKVASKFTDAFVIGADQVLVLDGKIFDKPTTKEDAKNQLLQLRNNRHQLLSAAVIFHRGEPVFRHIGTVKLKMRDFSDQFLADYLEKVGETLMDTVGGYKIEGMGVQLFDHINGDYFSILGMPLMEILGFLRIRGVIPQ